LKCFKGRKIKKLKSFQIWWDPRIAVVDNGYAAASLKLKCFNEKNKIFIYLFIYYLLFLFISFSKKNSSWVGPTHSRRRQQLCCSPTGTEMFQGKFFKNYFIFIKFFQVRRDPCIAVVNDGYAPTLVGLECFKGKKKKGKKKRGKKLLLLLFSL
jgi:hypothetical protein